MQLPKVLLVNDDAASLLALESVLLGANRPYEYELVTATSGQEALRQVLTDEFAVILLDANMPSMDGFETAAAIHSHPRSSSVPIIFITAFYADDVHRLKAYQSGAVDYLLTPVIPQVLQTKVGVFVELSRKNMELQSKNAELSLLNQDLQVQRLQDLERINRELEQEVAERKLAEERAHALSIRDPLTNLVNRRSLIAQLEHAVAYADRHQSEFAMLSLNLDRFKAINDSHGHQAGDELLRQVSARLLAAVRVSDVVARLSGDEFVVLLEGPGAAANAARVARKIDQAHALAFDINGQRMKISPSIGIAIYPQDAGSAAQLMKNADSALYHAKARRHGSIEFFREELNARESLRRTRIKALHLAFEQGEFELCFQPKASVGERKLVGVEALLYWRRATQEPLALEIGSAGDSGFEADFELQSAREFLHDLDDNPLVERIADWAVEQACQQLAAWRSSNVALPALTLSLDLPLLPHSSAQVERIVEHVRRAGLEAGELELELAEHLVAGQGGAQSASFLHQLHAGGIKLALDDFGSAGASLAALKALPLDVIKLDAAFVAAIGVDGGTDMAAAVIHLGRALGARVVAQGVETEEQLAVLASLGCDAFQGPLFSPALQADGLLPLLVAAGPQDLIAHPHKSRSMTATSSSRSTNSSSSGDRQAPTTPKQRG